MPASLEHPELAQPVDRLSPAAAPEAEEDLAATRLDRERRAVLLGEHLVDPPGWRARRGQQVEEAMLVPSANRVVEAGGGLERDTRIAAAGDHQRHLLDRRHEGPAAAQLHPSTDRGHRA